MNSDLLQQIDLLCDDINEGIFNSMPSRPSNSIQSKMSGDTDRITQAIKYQNQVEKLIKDRKKKKDKKDNRLGWLFKSKNEDILRIAEQIDILLEATKKAHSWPKGGGKICDKGLASAKKKYKGKWSAYAAGYATQVCKGKKK